MVSEILWADLVITAGGRTVYEIAATGTHEELLETNEIYSEIYHSQLVEDAVLEDQPNPEISTGQEA